jgi:hypothetical protein
VPKRIVVLLFAQRAHQLAGALLIGERFAVLEGQIGEYFFHPQPVALVAGGEGVARGGERQAIGGERLRRAAEHVARELVEDDDAGEAFVRQPEPFAVPGKLCVQRQEAPAHLGVERRVLLEPALVRDAVLGVAAEPEAQHFGC